MINYKTINKNENVMVCYSEFTPPKGVTEYQVMIQLTKPGQSYEEQLKLLLDTYSDLKENEFKKGTTIRPTCFWQRKRNTRIVPYPS